MVMQLGDWDIQTVSGGKFWIDGGSMFGVVPRVIWSRYITPDEQNRIQQQTNCVLIRTGRENVLIDTGYGGKMSEKERANFQIDPGDPLIDNLAKSGLSPEDIHLVVLSHLHFDHAGGATRFNSGGQVVPTFPNATYVAQRREWVTANAEYPELRGAYNLRDFVPFRDSGQLRLIDGNAEIIPGLRAWVTGGHTEGHQSLVLENGGHGAVYLGDICPTFRHLPTTWCIAYDLEILKLRRIKPEVLGFIADRGYWALADHDPDHAAAKLRRDARRDFAVSESLSTL